MGRIIATLNMTMDGYCDHTAVSPGEDVHRFFTSLPEGSDVILYGRKTFELMRYWDSYSEQSPDGDGLMDFARAYRGIRKIVFTRTLTDPDGNRAEISAIPLERSLRDLKAGDTGSILIGSPSLIRQALNLGVVDEFCVVVHPVVAGGGMALFDGVRPMSFSGMSRQTRFDSGAVALHFETSIGIREIHGDS